MLAVNDSLAGSHRLCLVSMDSRSSAVGFTLVQPMSLLADKPAVASTQGWHLNE